MPNKTIQWPWQEDGLSFGSGVPNTKLLLGHSSPVNVMIYFSSFTELLIIPTGFSDWSFVWRGSSTVRHNLRRIWSWKRYSRWQTKTPTMAGVLFLIHFGMVQNMNVRSDTLFWMQMWSLCVKPGWYDVNPKWFGCERANHQGHSQPCDILYNVDFSFFSLKGKLSHWLQKALGNATENVDFVLIDRASNRYKVWNGPSKMQALVQTCIQLSIHPSTYMFLMYYLLSIILRLTVTTRGRTKAQVSKEFFWILSTLTLVCLYCHVRGKILCLFPPPSPPPTPPPSLPHHLDSSLVNSFICSNMTAAPYRCPCVTAPCRWPCVTAPRCSPVTGRVPCVARDSRPVTAISKHLCGAATGGWHLCDVSRRVHSLLVHHREKASIISYNRRTGSGVPPISKWLTIHIHSVKLSIGSIRFDCMSVVSSRFTRASTR